MMLRGVSLSAVIKPGTVRFCVIDSQGTMQYCKLGTGCQIAVFVTVWQVPQCICCLHVYFNQWLNVCDFNQRVFFVQLYIKEPQWLPIEDIVATQILLKKACVEKSSSHFDEKCTVWILTVRLLSQHFMEEQTFDMKVIAIEILFSVWPFIRDWIKLTLIPHKTGSSIIVSVVVFFSTTWLWENISLSFHQVFSWSLNIGKANIHEIVN